MLWGDSLQSLHPEIVDSVLSLLAFHKGHGLWHLIKTSWGGGVRFRHRVPSAGRIIPVNKVRFKDHIIRLAGEAPSGELQRGLLLSITYLKLLQELEISPAHPAQLPAHRSQLPLCRMSELGKL